MHGVIAAGSQETANAGAAMFALGGNAVDAAVAAAFASFISETGLVHLGGSGLAQVFDPRLGHSVVYDFFSTMPGLGGPKPQNMDFARVTVDFGGTTQDFHLGRASVAVPGNILGLCQMAADYGRLPLPTILGPAIRLAREGTALEPFQADTCKLLAPLYTHTAGMRAIFAANGRIIGHHEHLFIPDLAETLETLAQEGAEWARNGRLAQAILADQAANGGLLTQTDLDQYEVFKLDAIRLPYRGYEILLPPLSSTGGVLTAFTLALLGSVDVAGMAHGSLPHLRLLYEVQAATTRARLVWDKISEELSPQEAMTQFLAESFIRPYREELHERLNGRTASQGVAEPKSPNNTSHLSCMDADGMVVSLTTTAGESAGYVVAGTGYIPNNMLGEEDLHPHGFHVRPAGQRIYTMMTPAVILANGRPRLVLGSGGSARIRSAIMQVISNLLDYRFTLTNAVEAPRVHLQGDVLQCEAGFDETAVAALEEMGYAVNRWQTRSLYFGGAHCVSCTPDGRLVAAGDGRRGGAVAMV